MPILRQLWLYMGYFKEFQGDLNKGIMLMGSYGCGKSLLMESYAHLQNILISHGGFSKYNLITFINSISLVDGIVKSDSGIKAYAYRPLIIDEFGREPMQVMEFGNIMTPTSDLLLARADSPVITHGTTNFSLETLSNQNHYGSMLGDRLRAMFNFIRVEGGSRRR